MTENTELRQDVRSQDRLILRCELPKLLNVHTETVRKWLKAGLLPTPDVNLSQKTRGWWASTLTKAGINLQGQSATEPRP